jgi:cytochrome c
MRGHGGPVRSLVVNGAARELISGSFDSTVIVWDLDRGIAKRVLRFHDGPVSSLTPLAEGCFASSSDDARIAVWCPGNDRPAHVFSGHGGPVAAVAEADFRGFGLVSAGQDGTIRQWVLGISGERRRLIDFRAPATTMAKIGQAAVVVATADGKLTKLVGAEAVASTSLTAPVAAIASWTAGSQTEVITASADGIVRVFDGDLRQIAEIEVDGIPLSSLALTPIPHLIATAGLRGGIAIIDLMSRKILHRMTGPGLPVWSLAFDTDSRTLISGGADRLIRKWDAIEGKALNSVLPERDIVAEAVASGERGAQVFRACQACHTLSPDDGNRAGPTLSGIFGRRIGTATGYAYSEVLPKMSIVWNRETIARLFEIGPNAYTPGTKMPEQTITDAADRQALVEWLERVTAPR